MIQSKLQSNNAILVSGFPNVMTLVLSILLFLYVCIFKYSEVPFCSFSPPSVHVLVLLQICLTGGQLHYRLIRYKVPCRMVNEVRSIKAFRLDAITVNQDHCKRLSSRTRPKCSSGKRRPATETASSSGCGSDQRLFAEHASQPVAGTF